MSIKDEALRATVLKALKDAIGDEYDTSRDVLHRALTDLSETTGAKSVTVTLDGADIATVTLGGGSPRASVTNDAALLEWVAERHPAEVETLRRVRPAFLTRLLAEATRAGVPYDATGEELPGVAVRSSEPYPGTRFKPGGREAVAAAWAAGTLPPELLRADVLALESDDE